MKRTVQCSFLLLFFICSFLREGMGQSVQTGKSYINISKGAVGGTIEAGDTLEIRATIAVGCWGCGTITLTNAYFIDSIPANTIYVPGSMKLVSNEGVTLRSFSDGADADQGYYSGGHLRMNIGSTYNGGSASSVNLGSSCSTTATGSGGGTIKSNGRPSFYNTVCIISASYRIVVDPALTIGSSINMYGGAFRYKLGSNIVAGLNAYTLQLSEDLGLCTNSIGANAILDNGGTFGSGNTQDRSTSAIVPGYTFTSVGSNSPNDGSYAIVNNLSPTGSTNENDPKPGNTHVFNLWDIMGDHTGSSNGTGNPPVAPGSNGGYFVAINASYANSDAIQQTVSGLCPNTYYEFSAWFRNICEYCACDTTGDAPYSGSTPNTSFNGIDSSGVNPNLTFTVDGVDLYTTGNIPYTGEWVKKGFVLQTGPGQTSFTLTIRNNAPGGGGNDWAIDDVTLATCTPNLTLTPSGGANVCYGNQVDMSTLVRSYYPNYTQWTWERSLDGGATWNSTGVSGTGSPTQVSGEWEYTSNYPSFLADSSVHHNMFRIKVASTGSNLADDACSFTASNTIIVYVNNCSTVLPTRLISFDASLGSDFRANLHWVCENEEDGVQYQIERSENGRDYYRIASTPASGEGNYTFADGKQVDNLSYYRIKVVTRSGAFAYSKLVLVNRKKYFGLQYMVNPFNQQLSFSLITPESGALEVALIDELGRSLWTGRQLLYEGLNTVKYNLPGQLARGVYTLHIRLGNHILQKRVLKQ